MAVRRVRRIIRRIDPWTVLKVSLVFNAIAALVFVLGTWVTWSMALRRGIPDRVVDIFESLTLTLTVDGELYFRIVVLLAVIGAILMTAFMTLGAVLYNLIADLVGGVEIAVLEETYRPAATRTRMKPAVSTAPVVEHWPVDAEVVEAVVIEPSETPPEVPEPEVPLPEAPAAAVEPAAPAAETDPVAATLPGMSDTDAEESGAQQAAGEDEVPRIRAG
jgi:hypothetical protein